MKKILTIILILFSFSAYSQHDTVDIVLSGGSSTDTASLSNRINLKKNSVDSVSGVATDYVTQYQRKKTSDSLQANIDLKLNKTDTTAMLQPYYIDVASVTGGFRLIRRSGAADTLLFTSIDTTFLHDRGVLSYSINGSGDSSILVLNGGARYAVAIGAGGGGYVSGRWSRSSFDTTRYYHTGWAGVGDTARAKFSLTSNNLGVNSGGSASLAATSDSTGMVLINNTAAAAGAQQASPALAFLGNGWKTNATAASQKVGWRMFSLPVQGTTGATASFNIEPYTTSGGAYSAGSTFVLTSTTLTTTTTLNATLGLSTNGTISGSALAANAASTITLAGNTTSITNGLTFPTAVTTAGTPVRYGSAVVTSGRVWNTTSAADNYANFRYYVKPVSGATPTASQIWQSGVNGIPTYTDVLELFDNGRLKLYNTVTLKAYTVATLPAGNQGDEAYVTDATAPTYLGALTGGGAVVCPVFYNGSAWVSH